MRIGRRGGTAALALLAGCATSGSLSAAPTLNTAGHLGTEERLEVRGAVGDERFRIYTALAGGAGLAPGGAPGYWLLAPEAGVETGQTYRLSGGGLLGVRHLGGGVGFELTSGLWGRSCCSRCAAWAGRTARSAWARAWRRRPR